MPPCLINTGCIIKKSSSRYPVLYYVWSYSGLQTRNPTYPSGRGGSPLRRPQLYHTRSTAEILSRTSGYMYQSYLQDFQTALRF